MSRRLLVAAILTSLAVVLVLWGMSRPVPMDRDAQYYAQVMLGLRGESKPDAIVEAARTFCDSVDRVGMAEGYRARVEKYLGTHPEALARSQTATYVAPVRAGQPPSTWVGQCAAHLVDRPFSSDPRYIHIFESRPLFPALSAPLVDGLGVEAALRLVASLGAALAGVLLAGSGRLCGLSWPGAIAAQAALYLSLFAYWGTRPFAEGLAGAVTALLVFGVCLAPHRRSAGVVIQVVAALLMVLTKSHAGVMLGAAMLLALGLARMLHLAHRIGAMLPGPILALVAGLAVPPLMGWATVNDSLQDLATDHFSRHDVSDPWKAYRYLLKSYLIQAYQNPQIILVTLVSVAVVIAVMILRPKAEVWAAVWGPIAVGVGSVIAHPALTTASRLFSAAWPGLILAAALLADLMITRGWRAVAARRTRE